MSRRSSPRRRRSTSRRHEGVGLLLILAAALLALSFLPRPRGVAFTLGEWQRVILGGAAPAIPALLLLAGLTVILARGHARFTRRVQALVLGGLVALTVAHASVPGGEEFAAMRAGEGGGAVGAALVWAARRALGEPGLWLLIALGALSALGMFLGLSAARAIHGVASVVRALLAGLEAGGRALSHGAARMGLLTGRGVTRLAEALVPRVSAAAGAVRTAARTRWVPVGRAARQWLGVRTPALEGPSPNVPPGVPRDREAVATSSTEVAPMGTLTLDAQLIEAEAAGPPPPTDAEPPAPPAARRRGRGAGGKERVVQEFLLPELAPPAGSISGESTEPEFQLPPLSLLSDLPPGKRGQRWEPGETAQALEQTLASFGVEARVVHWEQGPVVTRFEVQPAPGVKVQRIASLTNDIALHLAAPSVRIEAPIPGKSAVGIEIPNQKASLVHVKEILAADSYQALRGSLLMALGKDLTGHPIVADLTEMPHLLIAGTTGSGKSVMINAIIASLLVRYTPRRVRFVMIDPKRVELTNYNDIPHLLIPVVTNPRATAGALKEMLRVMEERFELFAQAGVRNIQAYNALTDVTPLPFIVIVVDELADLMIVAPADFEDVIVRLAQMTRATGIHLVVATQRPSVDVITGLIKANIPSRIAFAVSSQVDSRTIIDGPGAEKLLGRGDMLFLPIGASRPVRAQGSFIGDGEIQALVDWWRGQGKPVFDETLVHAGQRTAAANGGEDHQRLAEAARIVVRAGYGSVSLLQRKMRVGYVTAARLIDQLEERGIVGPAQGSTPREVLVGVQEMERLLSAPPAQGGRS